MGCFEIPGLELEFCDLLAPSPTHPSGAFCCTLCSGRLCTACLCTVLDLLCALCL